MSSFAPFFFRRTSHIRTGRNSNNVYDFAVVGGGAMGSSTAYFIAKRIAPAMGRICVIERDPTVSYVMNPELGHAIFVRRKRFGSDGRIHSHFGSMLNDRGF